jgi:hypothetical protein
MQRKESTMPAHIHSTRRFSRTMGALVAAGALALVVAAGVALASTGGSSHSKTRTLHFLLRETPQVLDRPPAGPSNGDIVLLHGDLLDPTTRAAVGTEIGAYIAVGSANDNHSIANVVFTPNARTRLSMADQIAFQTIFDSVPGGQIAPITGGSGRYEGAKGQIVSTDGPDGLIDVVIHLRTP